MELLRPNPSVWSLLAAEKNFLRTNFTYSRGNISRIPLPNIMDYQ
jgi:hypothetical protein